VPYIYEDRISKEDFINALKKALNLSDKAYKKMSIQGREHVKNNYNFENYKNRWIEIMDQVIEDHGSWENRKKYRTWHLMEVA
jgi:glycosyltransferase involved in cell wall biosynthesis